MTTSRDSGTAAQPAHEARARALRQAAADKRAQAAARAEAGIRALVKDRQDINFRTVARAAGVSLDFLYSHSDLRQRIETLRDQQQIAAPEHPTKGADDGAVVHTLTQTLRRERADKRARIQELEQRLAAAHGELLHLRRVLQQHGIER
jgi:hypothetical protein